MSKVIVIGGGASGMMAGYSSAKVGNQVTLIEKNEKLGKKIYITGKGRCNLTNDTLPNEFLNYVVSNSKFMYGSIFSFSPQQTQEFFEEHGLNLKVERGNRVFPASDKASDVTKTLEKALKKHNVNVLLNAEVVDVVVENGKARGVKLKNGETLFCDSIIVCTGGISYPLTGSTGDGYKFATKTGHNLTPLKAGLTGIELVGSDFISLQGLSLKNVSLTAFLGDKIVYSDFGEMLFTHFGISGPIVLSCSSAINRLDLSNVRLSIDLKPALDEKTLDNRLVREFSVEQTKNLSNVMRSLLPQSLIPIILKNSSVSGNKQSCNISKDERKRIIRSLKDLSFNVKRLRPIDEAIITCGGVSVKEINPKTMESKLIQGLFFAGEVIDVDCFTGGFNLQVAFSTGFVAGRNS